MDNYIKVIIYEIRCKNRNRVQYTIYNTVFVDSSLHILNTADAGVDILTV